MGILNTVKNEMEGSLTLCYNLAQFLLKRFAHPPAVLPHAGGGHG